jgi:hypothetical protein
VVNTCDSLIFYTHKKSYFNNFYNILLIFDVFIYNLNTITGQDTANPMIFCIVLYKFCFVKTFVSHMGFHITSIICTVLYTLF